MKRSIINISIIFFISISSSGCFYNEEAIPPVNTYAIEKSAALKNNNINSKIINETPEMSLPFPYSLNILFLSNETITSLIPLADKGIMSTRYYLNEYKDEQSLIYAMFKKRNSFKNINIDYVNEVSTPLNDKKYDYLMYFDTSSVGNLDIYLKDTSSNKAFLVWSAGTTKTDPIQAVENILNNKLAAYLATLKESEQVLESKKSSTSSTSNSKTISKDKETKETKETIPTITPKVTLKDSTIKSKETIQKTIPKKIKKNIIVKKTDTKLSIPPTISVQNPTPKTKKVRYYSPKISMKNVIKKDSMPKKTNKITGMVKSNYKAKNIYTTSYYNMTREYDGCFAFGVLNQCVVW